MLLLEAHSRLSQTVQVQPDCQLCIKCNTCTPKIWQQVELLPALGAWWVKSSHQMLLLQAKVARTTCRLSACTANYKMGCCMRRP